MGWGGDKAKSDNSIRLTNQLRRIQIKKETGVKDRKVLKNLPERPGGRLGKEKLQNCACVAQDREN